MEKIFGYIRYYKNDTEKDLQQLDSQLRSLGVTNDKLIFHEFDKGTNKYNTMYKEILHRSTPGDTIITTDYTRISYSPVSLYNLFNTIKEYKLRLIIGNITFDCRDDTLSDHTKGMLDMLSIINDMVSDASEKRSSIAESKGNKLGRNALQYDDLPEDFRKLYPAIKNKDVSTTDVAKKLNVSRRTVYHYIYIAKDYEKENHIDLCIS
ncbi:recombinase family protein [Butyrivibrio sp. AE3004]|uniref:recombinase family protein n=1 Tax=Butyrivibrio sp. AE3004 TaxID=1506994 RepID=UPI000494688D|nr:recombinase family protein [Butyrivibrio sp. AE3004]